MSDMAGGNANDLIRNLMRQGLSDTLRQADQEAEERERKEKQEAVARRKEQEKEKKRREQEEKINRLTTGSLSSRINYFSQLFPNFKLDNPGMDPGKYKEGMQTYVVVCSAVIWDLLSDDAQTRYDAAKLVFTIHTSVFLNMGDLVVLRAAGSEYVRHSASIYDRRYAIDKMNEWAETIDDGGGSERLPLRLMRLFGEPIVGPWEILEKKDLAWLRAHGYIS